MQQAEKSKFLLSSETQKLPEKLRLWTSYKRVLVGALFSNVSRMRQRPQIWMRSICYKIANLAYAGPLAVLLALLPMTVQGQDLDPRTDPVEEVIAALPHSHPSSYYYLAARLFESEQPDEAVFWFYAGQLRYRFHLLANPELPPDGDPALFAALSEVLGAPLNEYAFGDINRLAQTLDDVLDWDESTPNEVTDKLRYAEQWKAVRDGLGRLRAQILEEADTIRTERAQRGLENR